MQRREFMAGTAFLAVFGAQAARAVVRDPLPPQGVEFTYRILFRDAEIGQQKVRIRKHDLAGHVVIEHETQMQVRILFSVAYALDHRSTEVWDGFRLKSIRSETVENKERIVLNGEATEGGFRIRNADQEWLAPTGVVTSDSFWVAAAVDACRVVNARTGDTAAPAVTDLGNGRWHLRADFDHGPVEAKLRFDGDFLAEAEVDSDGHTVRLVRLAT